MGIAKIGGNTPVPAEYPIGLAAGETFILPSGQGNFGTFGAQVPPQINLPQVTFTGQYFLDLGDYSCLQTFDQSVNYWRNVCSGGPYAQPLLISVDGANFRVVNTTGCPIGALITNAGSAGVNGFYGFQQFPTGQNAVAVVVQNGFTTIGNTLFTATPSAGGSTWNMIVGGSVNTSVALTGTLFQNGPFGGTGPSVVGSGGSLYTRAPMVLFFPPPNQGNQPYFLPTAIATISAGAVNAITVLNQGAGLLGLPGILIVNAPGDTTGSGAVAGWTSGNSADANLGKLSAMWPSYYGTAQTSVPTITFAGANAPGSAAVTLIMNFTITGVGGTGGVGYGTTPGGVINGGIVAGSSAITNPAFDKNLSAPIAPPLNITTGTGVPALAGPFQGCGYQAVPVYTAIPNGTAAPTTANANTFTVGGASDVIYLASV